MIAFRLRTRLLASLTILAAGGTLLHAQESQPLPIESVAGTEHFVAFMTNGEPGAGLPTKFLGLQIASQFSTTGTVEIPGTEAPITFSIDRGEVKTIQIPASLELFNSEEVSSQGIRIRSRAPITVYAYNARNTSGSGFSVIPTSLWGNDYDLLTLPNRSGERTGQFLVMAAFDSTLIEIRPTAPTHYAGAGELIQKVLMRGQTYLVQASPDRPAIDLSGTTIRSTKPVGVITGHIRAYVGDAEPSADADPRSQLSAMLLPDAQLGTDYVSTPMRDGGDRFRVLSLTRDTRIEVTHFRPDGATDQLSKTLDFGETLDLNSINGHALTGPISWHASRPVSILQFRKSTTGATGMPAMLNLVPADKFSARTAFGAPAKLRDLDYSGHTLSLIARAEKPSDLESILLDGTPLHQIAPSLLKQQIGTTNYYYVSLPITAGGHTLVAGTGVGFSGILSGMTATGSAVSDYYAEILPFWLPQIGPDVKPPRVLTTAVPRKGWVDAVITDSTPEYFSGVNSVLLTGSPGWNQGKYDRPSPDDNASTSFTATVDPSGPLFAMLTDRDGNSTTVKLSDGVCFKTATADRATIDLHVGAGTIDTARVVLTANPCGDQANVLWTDKGNGNARGLITALLFDGGSTPLTIEPNGSRTLSAAIDALSASPGVYTTTLTVKVDDSLIAIPTTITIDAPSGVAMEEVAASRLSATVYPNPFNGSTTISLGAPLGRDGSLVITDRLGRAVRDLTAEAASGATTIRWNGLDPQGAPVPAGVYFLSIAEKGARAVRSITVLR